MTNSQRWKKTLAWLRKEFPPRLPLKVRCRPTVNQDGSCRIYGESINVSINSRGDLTTKLDSLLHEWAHALTLPNEAHGDAWGKQYAAIYSAWEKWGYGEEDR